MAPEATGGGVYALPYYSWVKSFEHATVADLLADLTEPSETDSFVSIEPEDPEGILLHTLAPVTVQDGGGGDGEYRMRSRRLPSVVADVAAEARAATTLLEQVFVSMFPANMEAVIPYVSPRRYLQSGRPDLLDLFSVAVLSGRPNYSGRRVLYEGGLLLEDLVAEGPQELAKVHGRLYEMVDSYLSRGDDKAARGAG